MVHRKTNFLFYYFKCSRLDEVEVVTHCRPNGQLVLRRTLRYTLSLSHLKPVNNVYFSPVYLVL